MPQQLVLNLNLPVMATFENYIKGSNDEAVNFLKDTFINRHESYVYLWGSKSIGKTHLLHACCHNINAKNQRAFYLDLSLHAQLKPEILNGLDQYSLICLDNIETIQTYHQWQEALFYFYNRCREQKISLLISAAIAPANLKLELADLQSRLSWGLILQLHPLMDAQKIIGLQQHAKSKGFQLSDEVTQYILSHYSRDMGKLMRLLEQIDKQSLIEKRRVTIPFIKSII